MLLWRHQVKLLNLINNVTKSQQTVKSPKMHFSWLKKMKKSVHTQQERTGQGDIGNRPANLRARRGTEQRRGLPESKTFCQTWRTQPCWSEMKIARKDVKSFSTVQAKDLTEDHVAYCQIVRCEKKNRWTISLLQAVQLHNWGNCVL